MVFTVGAHEGLKCGSETGRKGVTFDGTTVLAGGKPTTWMYLITATTVDFRAVFLHRKDYQAAGLVYTIQFSADLNTWVTRTTTPTVLADQGNAEIDVVYLPYRKLIQTSRGFEKPKYFRVGVSLPAP